MACRFAILLLATMFCRTTAASAQTITATVQGVVRDSSRAVVPGATVTVHDVDTGFLRSTTTDTTGAYVLPYVPAGSYDFTM